MYDYRRPCINEGCEGVAVAGDPLCSGCRQQEILDERRLEAVWCELRENIVPRFERYLEFVALHGP